MDYIRNLAFEVESIYKESQNSFSSYQSSQKLNCLTGCGKCCLSTQIQSTILEMIPTALYLHDQKRADQIYDALDLVDTENSICIFYQKHSEDGHLGKCTNYDLRPSVCRSFGAAAVKNKMGEKVASVCKLIKEKYPQEYAQMNLSEAPVIGEFARRIITLDTNLGLKLYPINHALKKAIEKVSMIAQLTENFKEIDT